MINRIKKYLISNPEKVLFIFSFIYLLIMGLLLSYNYNIKDNYNLIFDSDTARVIIDSTVIGLDHYRVNVHPLFILLIQPLCFILNGIVLNKMLSIIILSALTSSLSVLFIYKILDKVNKDNKTNILLSLIYLFSFSNIIFTASIETYNFAALFLIILWYYFISKTDKFTIYSYIILIILGILSFSFTLTNICIFFIVLFLLFINKKVNLKNSIIVCILVLISVVGLNITQKLVWNNTPFFWKVNVNEETTNYTEKKISLTNIKNVVKNDYYNSIISSDIYMDIKYGDKFNNQNYIITFTKTNPVNILLITIFYLTTIILLIRNFKKNRLFNTGLLLALIFNTCLHTIYGNDGTFLYSLHFLYLIILLFGINYLKEENTSIKKVLNVFVLIFLIIELIINNYIFIKVLDLVKGVISKNYLMTNLGTIPTIILELIIILIIGIIIFLIVNIIKSIKKEKNKEKKVLLYSSILGLVILIECIFIMLNSIEIQNKFLIFDLSNKNQEIVSKSKIEYTNKDFKEYFKKELSSLNEYNKELYNLKQTYQTKEVKNINWSDYYYFGMANRRKMMYQKNKIIDVDTKEVIKSFEEKEHYIIPNLYTVIIETIDGKYISIKEDKDGIHYIVNKKDTLLDNNKVELYSFNNQEYSNIKKVLYGELLFNIKDEVIYPNIIVYNNPWYRDAALTSMVLKQTNNTDLISNWVNNITDIYDLQNGGIQEPDNLGELLYILSTQNNPNKELIDRVEQEAERIATSNPNGYYIYGKTDFGDQHLYQNLWYKLGIESVGREFKFDLSTIPEDNYSKMSWWSDYEVKDKTPYEFSEQYPYLSYAANHKLKNTIIPMNENNYPLSWEMVASQANYDNYKDLDNIMTNSKISPLHSWSSSELLLWLLDETGDLDFK